MATYSVNPDSYVLSRYRDTLDRSHLGPIPDFYYEGNSEEEVRVKFRRDLIRYGYPGYAADDIVDTADILFKFK